MDVFDFMKSMSGRFSSGELSIRQTHRSDLQDRVRHVLAGMISQVPLKEAIALPAAERETMASIIDHAMSTHDLKELASFWEPARGKIEDAGWLSLQLKALLNGERDPYRGLPSPDALGSMGPGERDRVRHEIEHIAPVRDLQAMAKKMGLPKDANRRVLARSLLGAVEEAWTSAPASSPAPATAPARGRRRAAAREEAAPAATGDHHSWEPVKGKPGRRKRRLPNGKWHYEDVPMQKAGERKAEYLLRLMRWHLGEM